MFKKRHLPNLLISKSYILSENLRFFDILMFFHWDIIVLPNTANSGKIFA